MRCAKNQGDQIAVKVRSNPLTLATIIISYNIMKKNSLLMPLFFGILLTCSCSKEPPVVLFSTDKATYKMGETVTFTNQSENGKDYFWDFGDGKTSETENPTHIFTSAGDFPVKLIATNRGGNDSITVIVPILPDLTGLWYETVTYSFGGMGGFSIPGTMNVVQNADNTLTGSFVYTEGNRTRTANLKATSLISGNAVTIDWDTPALKLKGTVNSACTTMVGSFSSTNGQAGTWSATKL